MKTLTYIIHFFASAFVGLVAGLMIDKDALMRKMLPLRVWLSHSGNPLSRTIDRHRKKYNSRMQFNLIYGRAVDYLKSSEAYLNPDLKLEDVSKAIFTNRQYLSCAMKMSPDGSFIACVNRFRIQHAMVLYIKNQGMAVNDLCRMSGFNCPNTFRRVFKESVHKTPQEWCNEYKRKATKAKRY